jgi:hypothetical protein
MRAALLAVVLFAQASGPSDPNAMAMVRRVIDQKGGVSALRNLHTVVVETTTALHTRPESISSTTRTYIVYPDRYRVDAVVHDARGREATLVQTYDAGTAWVQDTDGVRDAPAATRSDFAAGVKRDVVSLLLGALDGTVRVRLLEPRVLEFSGAGLAPVRVSVDEAMNVTKLEYATPGADGRAIAAQELFSDYRVVDGVRVAFRAEVLNAGRPILTRTVTRVTINAPVDPSLFAKPR